MTQLNKLQIKAEILTAISKLQNDIETPNVDKILETLLQQEDKKAILDVLNKEILKSNEPKTVLISFIMLKLCDEKDVENAFWNVLKNPTVSDSTKTIILNILKEMGSKVNYDKIEEYFEHPDEVIDADTQKLLQSAIINPEAQIDFLDFVTALPAFDAKVLIQSLGDDYSSDDLANILNPLVLYNPNSELGEIAIDILGSTKSQLALHTLKETLEFLDSDKTSLIKKNISKLKISGVREDNTVEFYKEVLSESKPYQSYTSYPDGHGNQALIFSRQREDETIQICAVVINDITGIVDCFGFNEISRKEFERIVDRFYNGESRVYLDPHVIKTMLIDAENKTRKSGQKISYEYICWKTLLADISEEPVPIEITLSSQLEKKGLTEEDLEIIYNFDFVQKWFFDTDENDDFKDLIDSLNNRMSADDFSFDFEEAATKSFEKIFNKQQKKLLDKRILVSSYLRYLAGNKVEAQLLFSLYYDENKKADVAKNIIRKSIYEYYVLLKFKHKEENKMTNIFAKRNKQRVLELTPKQIDLAISIIEGLWVK